MILGLLAALLAQLPSGPAAPFAEPVRVEVWAPEDWPVEDLARAAELPGATLAVATRSNMLAPGLFRLVARRKAVFLRVWPGLVPAHVDQYRKLGRATLVLALPENPDGALAARLGHLGPQTVRFEVARLDEARFQWLSGFKNAEVELDLRGRVPDQDEVARFLRLTRARRVVRLSSGDPAALLAGLSVVGPSRVVVESPRGALPADLARALADLGAPVRLRVEPGADPGQIKGLARLPGLSLEVAPRTPADLAGIEGLLSGLARQAP